MVISIIMVILGVIAMVQLPIAMFPNIAPPEILLQATYVGADAVTDGRDVTPVDGDVCSSRRAARAVDDLAAADHQIVLGHGTPVRCSL